MAAGLPALAQDAGLQSNVSESAEGYYQLAWHSDVPVRLVEATRADFADARILYEGADSARVISGKPDGEWFYRLESSDTGTSLGSPVRVTVSHHPLSRAMAFFAVGAVVFVATLGLVVLGGRVAAVR